MICIVSVAHLHPAMPGTSLKRGGGVSPAIACCLCTRRTAFGVLPPNMTYRRHTVRGQAVLQKHERSLLLCLEVGFVVILQSRLSETNQA